MERRDKGQDIVLVASEPLTFERADWVTVPSNCNILPRGADGSDVDNQWTDGAAASYYWYCILFLAYADEHHVADPLHTRRNGFAESKGQSSIVA
jgi:glutamine amidotransferase